MLRRNLQKLHRTKAGNSRETKPKRAGGGERINADIMRAAEIAAGEPSIAALIFLD